MLQKIFGYKVELVEHCSEYTLVIADKAVKVGTQIPVKVSGANGKRTPAIPMIVVSCRPCEHEGFLVTGRFLVEHPDLTGFEIPSSMGCDSSLRSAHRVNCHLCVISKDLPGYRAMTIDLSEGGLQVEAPARVALGNSVLLRLEFDVEDLPPIQASATVAWCSRLESGQYRIGLQFKSLDENATKVIGLYKGLQVQQGGSDGESVCPKREGELLDSEVWDDLGGLTTLQVPDWHQVPLMTSAVLTGYRRTGSVFQLRLRGGKTGQRVSDYVFQDLRGLIDHLEGDPSAKPVEEFRFTGMNDGFYRFELLGKNQSLLLQVEAKLCHKRSPEQN